MIRSDRKASPAAQPFRILPALGQRKGGRVLGEMLVSSLCVNQHRKTLCLLGQLLDRTHPTGVVRRVGIPDRWRSVRLKPIRRVYASG